MATNWKLVAVKVAEKYGLSSESGTVVKYAQVIFGFQSIKQNETLYANNTLKGYIYNYVMTLANRQGMVESDKIRLLKQFVKQVDTKHEDKFVDIVLSDAGYINPYRNIGNLINVKEAEFSKRQFHPQIVEHCQKLFSDGYYFYAVQEACKIYDDKIRELTGSDESGTKLVQKELGSGGKVKFNSGKSTSEKNEQNGIRALSEGLVAALRNPTAHEPSKKWDINQEDCLDILSLVSYLFRKLDKATIIQ